MGIVVLAEDTLLGRKVALKRLMAAGDPHKGLRLRREALIGASISHANLVSVYDVAAGEDGNLVVVMEYVEGQTLARKLDQEGRLPGGETVRILGGVAAALDAIHARGIVHRDVKPPNILLGSSDVVKLADLGVASVPDHTRITSSGAVVGSLRYMAPEQVENARITTAIDIYALGAVAFEMLAGRKARREENPLALAHAIATQPPPDLREAWPQASAPAAAVLQRAMARDPGHRPSSAGEVVDELERALAHRTPPARAARPAGATRPVRPAQAARPVRRAQAARPVRRAQAARPVRPAQAARPVRPAEATRPVRPAEASRPAQTERRRWALGAAAVVALLIAATLAVIISSTGSTRSPGAPRAAGRSATHHAGSSKTSASGTTTAAGPSGGDTATPIAAVESFYSLGATHRYRAAWSLADPEFRNQLGSYEGFTGGQAQVRAVRFDSARVLSQSGNSATVALRTTSTHTDGAHQCSGTVDVVRDGSTGTWLLHQIDINCT